MGNENEQKQKQEQEQSKPDKAAVDAYGKMLKRARDAERATGTAYFKALFLDINRAIADAAERVLNEEKNRDVIACQEQVKTLRTLLNRMKQPATDCQNFKQRYPLFIGKHGDEEVTFDQKSGQIHVVEAKKEEKAGDEAAA